MRTYMEPVMYRLMLPVMVAAAVLLTGPATSFAAAAVRSVPGAVAQTAVQPVYYMYNHHRYEHRSWDKAHKRWHYY
jgi:membrane protein YdbS with pleckstrin-like domain